MATGQPKNYQQVSGRLARLVVQGLGARGIGFTVAATWREVDAALSPVIGQHGVAALYARSVALTSTTFPWLAPAQTNARSPRDFSVIESSLAKQTPDDAAAGGGALIEIFCQLLASMIGVALTEELLASVWSRIFKP